MKRREGSACKRSQRGEPDAFCVKASFFVYFSQKSDAIFGTDSKNNFSFTSLLTGGK